jgi:hypothetical protein
MARHPRGTSGLESRKCSPTPLCLIIQSQISENKRDIELQMFEADWDIPKTQILEFLLTDSSSAPYEFITFVVDQGPARQTFIIQSCLIAIHCPSLDAVADVPKEEPPIVILENVEINTFWIFLYYLYNCDIIMSRMGVHICSSLPFLPAYPAPRCTGLGGDVAGAYEDYGPEPIPRFWRLFESFQHSHTQHLLKMAMSQIH